MSTSTLEHDARRVLAPGMRVQGSLCSTHSPGGERSIRRLHPGHRLPGRGAAEAPPALPSAQRLQLAADAGAKVAYHEGKMLGTCMDHDALQLRPFPSWVHLLLRY